MTVNELAAEMVHDSMDRVHRRRQEGKPTTKQDLKELLHDFTVWIEIGGLVEENANRTEQDWLDQIDSFLEQR